MPSITNQSKSMTQNTSVSIICTNTDYSFQELQILWDWLSPDWQVIRVIQKVLDYILQTINPECWQVLLWNKTCSCMFAINLKLKSINDCAAPGKTKHELQQICTSCPPITQKSGHFIKILMLNTGRSKSLIPVSVIWTAETCIDTRHLPTWTVFNEV